MVLSTKLHRGVGEQGRVVERCRRETQITLNEGRVRHGFERPLIKRLTIPHYLHLNEIR